MALYRVSGVYISLLRTKSQRCHLKIAGFPPTNVYPIMERNNSALH